MRALPLMLAATLIAAGPAAAQGTREVAFVANSEDGTVSLVDIASRREVKRLDINPQKATTATAVGSPNFAQDTDVSPDGRTLYVSRGYLGDVAAFDVRTGRMLWRTPVDPQRADHMVLSADGKALFVSALSLDRARRLDAATGAITGEVVTGDVPHDNQMSKDGRWLFNTSIGDTTLPPMPDAAVDAKSPFQLTVADARTLEVKTRHPFARGIRPWRLSPDEKSLYAQLSDMHGVVAYDMGARRITRRLELPVGPGVTKADWVFAAPHHGLALSADGRTLCIAGRASDYAALVRAPELTLIAAVPVGDSPGWSELADNDRLCLTANTRSDDFSFVSVAERNEIVRIKLGDGPKHITVARVPAEALRK